MDRNKLDGIYKMATLFCLAGSPFDDDQPLTPYEQGLALVREREKEEREGAKLVDKSLIESGIAEARRLTSSKWKSSETWKKVESLSGGKLNKNNLDAIKQETLNLIQNIPCEIVSEKSLAEKVGAESAEAVFIEGDNKVYFKQSPMKYFWENNIIPSVDWYTTLGMHEISHAIHNLLINKGIYTEAIVKSIAIPKGKRFSVQEYIYSPTEMASRMTTTRYKYQLDSFTSESQIANNIFKLLNLPCEKDGPWWKVTFNSDYLAGRNAEGTGPNAFLLLENFFRNRPGKMFGAWANYDLPRLLTPYVKKIVDAGLTVTIWFDLKTMASAMSQIAVREQKNEAMPA